MMFLVSHSIIMQVITRELAQTLLVHLQLVPIIMATSKPQDGPIKA